MDELSLNDVNLSEMNLALLLGVLNDLEYHSQANLIMANYYDARLLDPPMKVSDLNVRDDVMVELVTDSSCSFVECNAPYNVWDKKAKIDFGKDVGFAATPMLSTSSMTGVSYRISQALLTAYLTVCRKHPESELGLSS